MNIFLFSESLKMKKNIGNINSARTGGRMIRFEELGFESFDAYLQRFFDTLLPSNKTYEYFVDWEKVKKAVNEHLDEIYLLNSLSEVENRERGKKLAELLKKYPQVVEVIPLLIAERVKRGVIEIFDPEIEAFLEFSFAKSRVNEKTIPEIVKFCRNTGAF
ncbi:hypothetical protein DRQ18_03905 [bacterium]|nr:MAG: hypothetical protein DRQ18_03905 [bacterium]